jgi:hypothetical protein
MSKPYRTGSFFLGQPNLPVSQILFQIGKGRGSFEPCFGDEGYLGDLGVGEIEEDAVPSFRGESGTVAISYLLIRIGV